MTEKEARKICRQVWGVTTPYRLGRVIGATTKSIPVRNFYENKHITSQENFDKGVYDGITTKSYFPGINK